jgi:hypothetical protein
MRCHGLSSLNKLMNKTVVSQAQEFVWGLDDSQLPFVQKHIGTVPERVIIGRRPSTLPEEGERGAEGGWSPMSYTPPLSRRHTPPSHSTSSARHLATPKRRRALELLAGSPDGVPEVLMLAHGFTIELMVELARDFDLRARAKRRSTQILC